MLNEIVKDIKELVELDTKLEETELGQTVKPMLSNDYKERFRAEYYQAVTRRDRLKDIVNKYRSKELDFELKSSIGLLVAQMEVMSAYISILIERAKQEGIELY